MKNAVFLYNADKGREKINLFPESDYLPPYSEGYCALYRLQPYSYRIYFSSEKGFDIRVTLMWNINY